MAVLKDDANMVEMFQDAYGSEPNPADYGKALAVFQRHFIVTGPSPFDRYASGDTSAMDASAVRGMALFKGKGNCIACHNGPNFTDSGFYNVGLKHNPILDDEAHQKVLKFDAKRTKNADWESITTDPGRHLITHEDSDWGRFKTPTLRNLADTPPYMHDGRYWMLDEVIDHYDRGGDNVRNQDPRVKPLGLSDEEKQDLKAFLAALRGPLPEIRMEDWVRPVARPGSRRQGTVRGQGHLRQLPSARRPGCARRVSSLGGQPACAGRRRQLRCPDHHPRAQRRDQRSRQVVQRRHAADRHPTGTELCGDRRRRQLRSGRLGQSGDPRDRENGHAATIGRRPPRVRPTSNPRGGARTSADRAGKDRPIFRPRASIWFQR